MSGMSLEFGLKDGEVRRGESGAERTEKQSAMGWIEVGPSGAAEFGLKVEGFGLLDDGTEPADG